MLIFAIIAIVLTAVLLGIGVYRISPRYAVGQRIERIVEAEAQTAEEELEKPFFQRVVLPIGEAVAKMFRGATPDEAADRNMKKLVMAGLYPRVTPVQLQGLCWFCAAGCVMLMFIGLVAVGSIPGGSLDLRDPYNLVYLGIAVAAGYIIPQFILSRKVTQRQDEILIALPYAIDLLSISVEAGLGFDGAMGYTMRKTKGPLAEEFAKTLNEIRLGKPRLDALDDFGKRTGVEDLRTFITAVVHASRLGGSITQTLRVQADSIRIRRRQRAQEKAMKAPVKMLFPLVIFIFPAIFVVLLYPAVVAIMNAL